MLLAPGACRVAPLDLYPQILDLGERVARDKHFNLLNNNINEEKRELQ